MKQPNGRISTERVPPDHPGVVGWMVVGVGGGSVGGVVGWGWLGGWWGGGGGGEMGVI